MYLIFLHCCCGWLWAGKLLSFSLFIVDFPLVSVTRAHAPECVNLLIRVFRRMYHLAFITPPTQTGLNYLPHGAYQAKDN